LCESRQLRSATIRRAAEALCPRPTNSAKMANKGIFRLVTNANCPRTNRYVYISNDRAQACPEDPTCLSHLSKTEHSGRMARQKGHPGSARTTAPRVEVARYLSQAEFPCRNRQNAPLGAVWTVKSPRFAASASVRRGTLTLRCADNYSRTAASIALPELGFSRGSASCDTHAGAHIGFSMRQGGVQQREGRYPQHHLGKKDPARLWPLHSG
jgi:hypothetical protein